jgi:hypothetical protein
VGTTRPLGPQQQQEEALLLPASVRFIPHREDIDWAGEELQRCRHAQMCNVSFMQQGPAGQVAAVLSLQALLSLDPHGARVQQRPELLFYTPAGFHAAVAKTLMQALQGGASAGVGGSSHKAAAASTQQQQQQQDQDPMQPHPLHAWSEALLPVWYVWWHIGLLAYQQQQQQQAAAAGGSKSSSGTSAGSGSGNSNGRESSNGRGGSSSSSSSGKHTPREALKDMYASPDAR